jgi:lysophospholipase L1-like esterase
MRVGRVSLVVASLAAGLGLVELGLRAFVPAMAAGSAARFELDPDLIYRLRPDTVVTWSSPEFTETAHVNGRGMRGAALAPTRAGTQRIIAIGDSFTFGHGVQDDETYPAVLERLLEARGHDVQVLNAGVPGYNTDQAYTWMLRDGLALAPDLLLVGVHCSDVSDNFESSLYDVAEGHLVRRAARQTRMYRLGSVIGLIPSAVRSSRTFDLLVSSLEWHDAPSARPPVADLDAWSYAKIRLEVLDMAPRVPGLAVVLMPCKKALAGGSDPYGPLAGDLAAAGVPVLASTSAIATAAVDLATLFFRADPHLNPGGNRALAAAVAAFVESQQLLAKPPRVMAVRAPNG